MKDQLAEVAETCLVEETTSRPVQSTIDNCDQKGSHSTVEYLQVEYDDTSHLGVDAMGPEEVLQLFNVDLLLLNREELKPEKEHLEKVILTEAAKALALVRPEIGHWLRLLPKHHPHPNDHLQLREASIVLRPPHWLQVSHIIHPYEPSCWFCWLKTPSALRASSANPKTIKYSQETKQDEMCQLAAILQDEVLDTLKLQRPNDHQLHADLALIRKPVPGTERPEDKVVRLQAEQRVKCAVLDRGERVGHGDQGCRICGSVVAMLPGTFYFARHFIF